MKKKFSVLTLILIMSFTLVSCGKTDDQAEETPTTSDSGTADVTPQTDENITLKLANWDTDTMPYVPVLISEFEKANEGIKIDIIDIPSADYGTKLNVMLNSKSDVDVFWIKDGDTTKNHFNKNQLADLTPYINDEGIDIKDFNGLAERFVFDDKSVALPARTDYYVMYYNKDIFDDAGIDYPSNDMTWSQWQDLAKQLTSGEGATKKYGGFLHTWPACVQNWAVQDGKNTIMSENYSFMKPIYEMALDMQNEGTIMDYGTLQTGGIHYSSPFLQGDIAMLPMGTWFMATTIQKINDGESDINWGVATIPHPEGVKAGWTVGSTTPIAISEASENKDAAWKFVSFITSDEGAKIYAEYGMIPGRTSTNNLREISEVEGMPEEVLDALKVENISLDRPAEDNVSEINQMLGEEHSLIMLGEVTIDEGLATMGERSSEIQAK